jgi:hypothetical protein
MSADAPPPPGSTPGQQAARRTITRTTITPSPGTQREEPAPQVDRKRGLGFRRASGEHGDLNTAQAPLPGPRVLRAVMTTLLAVLCLLTVAGAVLMLLLWQQDRDSGVLSSQVDRIWRLFGQLQDIERIVALLIPPVAVAWIVVATINVRRATGIRRNPILAAISLPIGLAGVWIVGNEIVGPADDRITRAAGIVLQVVMASIPLFALERVATAAEARSRPLRATWIISAVFLAHLQGLSGLSTTEKTVDPDRWGLLGAYLVIAGLIQVLGTLAANEAGRAIEDATEHRYQLRHRFGEALIAQARRSG